MSITIKGVRNRVPLLNLMAVKIQSLRIFYCTYAVSGYIDEAFARVRSDIG
jgi:hypothetical protein